MSDQVDNKYRYPVVLILLGLSGSGAALAIAHCSGKDRIVDRSAELRSTTELRTQHTDAELRTGQSLSPHIPDSTELVERPVQRDPRARDYDAARLYATSWSDGQGIFQAEPRKEPWASQREQQVRDAITDAFRSVDEDAQISVECRTSTCSVRVDSPSRLLNGELDQFPLVCISSFVEPDFHPEAGYAEHYVIFGGDNLSSEGFEKQRSEECAKWRDAFIKRRDATATDAGSRD
ncbi:MAG TPA: hypothetical protein VFQ53_28325 [Kofleriaceae bacterium]|nr:hypothetical protein [Kofleriaceae bacterium]